MTVTMTGKCDQFNQLLKVNDHVMVLNVTLKMTNDKHFLSYTKHTKLIMTYILIKQYISVKYLL